MSKSTVAEIRARFDAEVERFSCLETGQTAAMDAPLALTLVARAAAASTPAAARLLDVGCGAGNFALRVLGELPGLTAVTLLDLSRPMLDRAAERVSAAGRRAVTTVQADVRDADLGDGAFDVIVAGAVLHHMRTDAEWAAVAVKLFRALAPGGGLWVFDLVAGATPPLHALAWGQYGDHLTAAGGPAHRDRVFAYIEREDSPRPVAEQLAHLRRAGFVGLDVLHKHGPFAAYGGTRPA